MDYLPLALGIISTLVSGVLGVVAWLQREKGKSDAALVTTLRAEADRERADRKAAELRLDAFRNQMGAVTDVLKRSIDFVERVTGTLPGPKRRAGG